MWNFGSIFCCRPLFLNIQAPKEASRTQFSLLMVSCRHSYASLYTDKKENEIQMGSVAKSYMRKRFLIYEEMRKYLTKICAEEAFSHIYDFATDLF
jgi:hypothetical protein